MSRFAIFMLLVSMLVCVAPCFEARIQLNNMDKEVTNFASSAPYKEGHIYGNLNAGPSPGAGHSGPPPRIGHVYENLNTGPSPGEGHSGPPPKIGNVYGNLNTGPSPGEGHSGPPPKIGNVYGN
ncbi:hypothetical protein EJD97_009208, partial [Solanum chilense]